VDIDAFISQYRPLWQRLEGACADGPRGLARRSGAEISEIVSLYQQTSAHLAEARTRYRDPELVAYLTRVVATAHGAIYGSRSRTVRGLLRLFGARYRRAIRGTWPHVAAASALLFGALALVALWTWTSPEAQAGLTPGFAEGFAERAGADPRDPSPGLSTFFLVHNFRVAVTAFALGITVLGTGYILVVNGANVGALAGTAHAVGEGWPFWALILPHGLIELAAICIAAGAGLRIGWALVEPGDRRRVEALQVEARESLLVIIGVFPAFAIAALIEGLLTDVTGVPALEVAVGVVVAVAYVLWLVGRRSEPPGRLDVEVAVGEAPGELVGRGVDDERAEPA
jgi:uncharacterized membrane protein SpoIIM required for sporulation